MSSTPENIRVIAAAIFAVALLHTFAAKQFERLSHRFPVRFARAVYVLHCFQKKSSSGIRTAQTDSDLIHERLKVA